MVAVVEPLVGAPVELVAEGEPVDDPLPVEPEEPPEADVVETGCLAGFLGFLLPLPVVAARALCTVWRRAAGRRCGARAWDR
jgi:hypothetical protein